MQTQSEFTIIGGGVAGLTAAIALKKIGRDFHLFEQVKELKGIGAGFGLAANAMQALEHIGLKDEIECLGYYIDSFAILDEKGKILVNPNTHVLSEKYDQKNFAIHRADLHLYLLSKIDQTQLTLGKKALKVDQKEEFVDVLFEDGTSHRTKFLIVADGVKSPIRQQLIPDSKPRYSGYSCWRATIDNTDLKLKKGTETWGNKGRFGLTPLINDRIYWYACINGPQKNPVFKNYNIRDLQKQFSTYHRPIQEVLSFTTDDQLIWSDIIDIKPLKHFSFHNILLIGDAAHACTPNMGQGACQAIEDVAVLMNELINQKNVISAFKSFEKRRIQRTKYITDTSKLIGEIAQWENRAFIAIRNKLMKIMPAKMNQRALNKLFEQDFMK
ncbi:FAD-dependent monooxygenase [Sphingobacterium endophyticum]|uniref:FAD-dependent monooxygenase n=1 Tax=Sphingobacterium endophyticum TaxID=2546448 RepID=UPI0012E0D267|nr:FAD-dependent monooxygenase [Sphingobacterium endophyticum]